MHPDHYGKAMECLSLAQSVREPAERLGLLAIAQSFLRLARHRDESCARAEGRFGDRREAATAK